MWGERGSDRFWYDRGGDECWGHGFAAGACLHYRLVAANVNDLQEPAQGADVVFGPPLIESESSVEVGGSAAKLQAEVEPQSVDTRVRVGIWHEHRIRREDREVDIGPGGALRWCRWRLRACLRARPTTTGLWRRTRSVKARRGARPRPCVHDAGCGFVPVGGCARLGTCFSA